MNKDLKQRTKREEQEQKSTFDVSGVIRRDKTKRQSSFIKLLSAVHNAERASRSTNGKPAK